MKIIDISGLISNRAWKYGPPYPDLNVWVRKEWMDGFGEFTFTQVDGLHVLTGTYVETPAHYMGYENSYLLADVPLEKLLNLDCVVLHLKDLKKDEDGRMYVTKEDLEACASAGLIKEGDAIIVDHGWGTKMWFDQNNFPMSPYFTMEAFQWLLAKKPYMLGSDTACWDNLKNPCGLFDGFYKQNVLMLAEVMNLEEVPDKRVKLNVVPMKLDNTCAAPCRAFIQFEE